MFCVSLANVSFYYKQAEAIITLLFDRICGWFYWQLPVSFMHTSRLLQGNFNAELSSKIALCFLPSQRQGFGWCSWTISVCKLEVMWGPGLPRWCEEQQMKLFEMFSPTGFNPTGLGCAVLGLSGPCAGGEGSMCVQLSIWAVQGWCPDLQLPHLPCPECGMCPSSHPQVPRLWHGSLEDFRT